MVQDVVVEDQDHSQDSPSGIYGSKKALAQVSLLTLQFSYVSIIPTLKYADELVLLAKEEKVLQDMIDKLIEIGGCYGMKMNVEKKQK